MSDLLLTLGHNASAILVDASDGHAHVANAYELERLTGVKSDSRFPVDAMVALREADSDVRFDRVYVTHWDPMNSVDGLKSKYWDRSVFPPSVPIVTQESIGLTHHDCHMRAAVAFAGRDFPTKDSGVLVIDGFGNMAEHISFYRFVNGTPHLVRRAYGYHTSMGLMYQYATAYLGMKMHEDEYKLLGYAAQVAETGIDVARLNAVVRSTATTVIKELRRASGKGANIGLDELPIVQEMWARRFDQALVDLGMVGVERTSGEARRVIGHVVQKVLQIVVCTLVEQEFGLPQNLILTGGCAFNVELGRTLLKLIPGKLCVMPLAGDQGNSLGLWVAHNKRTELHFGDLCWGIRRIDDSIQLPEGLVVVDGDGSEVYEAMAEALRTTGFVNFVRGRMEFGPRALCNTSTIALANRPDVVDEINRINGRDTVMPFAPVVWADLASDFFPDIGRLWKSERFMICALSYRDGVGQAWPGAALRTSAGEWTGRPQIYAQRLGEVDSIDRLLRENGGLLINTSFNVHGVPICCDLGDVIHSHQFQRERNPNVRTIVIKETK